jgi:hypothetical protein
VNRKKLFSRGEAPTDLFAPEPDGMEQSRRAGIANETSDEKGLST